jgi:dynein heavy chain
MPFTKITAMLAADKNVYLNAGSLSLETTPLKTSLKSEAASWKAQFAKNLHAQSAEDLKAFDAYIRQA